MTSKDYYFDSYSHFGIHEEMLKDRVRTEAYMNAIYDNKHLFRNKVVLDVGCGTGILSMFAAKAGARRVIGIDCAAIIHQAREIVEANGLSDVVTLVQGRVEDVVLPDGIKQVDIIISEWMGYFLLYESMLDTVLVARDKWLTPGGLLFPDKASLFLVAIEDADYKREKMDFWDNVYGFDMSCVKRLAMQEPVVDVCDAEQICTSASCVLSIDLATVTLEDLAFSAKFSLSAARNDYVHALVAYFDCTFSACHKPVMLSTSPRAPYTHWKQTVLYLDEVLVVNAGESLEGEIRVRRNEKNPRDVDIHLQLALDGEHGSYEVAQDYRLR